MYAFLLLVSLSVIFTYGIVVAVHLGNQHLVSILTKANIGIFIIVLIAAKYLSEDLNPRVYILLGLLAIVSVIAGRTTGTRS